MSRFTTEERQTVKDWLEQIASGKRASGYPFLRMAQARPIDAARRLQPTEYMLAADTIDVIELRAVEMAYGNRWSQWVALDAYDDQPVAFGRIVRRR